MEEKLEEKLDKKIEENLEENLEEDGHKKSRKRTLVNKKMQALKKQKYDLSKRMATEQRKERRKVKLSVGNMMTPIFIELGVIEEVYEKAFDKEFNENIRKLISDTLKANALVLFDSYEEKKEDVKQG